MRSLYWLNTHHFQPEPVVTVLCWFYKCSVLSGSRWSRSGRQTQNQNPNPPCWAWIQSFSNFHKSLESFSCRNHLNYLICFPWPRPRDIPTWFRKNTYIYTPKYFCWISIESWMSPLGEAKILWVGTTFELRSRHIKLKCRGLSVCGDGKPTGGQK